MKKEKAPVTEIEKTTNWLTGKGKYWNVYLEKYQLIWTKPSIFFWGGGGGIFLKFHEAKTKILAYFIL